MNNSNRISSQNFSQINQNSKYFQPISSTISNMPTNSNIYYQRLLNYSELIHQGSFYLVNNKYQDALETYEKALVLSEKMGDEYKKNESKCNIGIVHFYLGKVIESVNLIQPCFDYIFSICSSAKNNNTIQDLYLLCKSGANLSMGLLTMNSEKNNCLEIINNIISIISNEEDIYKHLFCIKYLNNILFRVNSLININYNFSNNFLYDNIYDENENNIINANQEQFKQINKIFFESFNNFILDQKIEPWIQSLNILYEKMEKLNDSLGLIYIIFNQQMATCLKNDNNPDNIQINLLNNEEVNDSKMKLKSLIEAIRQESSNNQNNDNNNFDNLNINNNEEQFQINDEYINNLIEDYKSKLFLIRKIYQMLSSFEEEICSKLPEDDDYDNNYISQNNNNFNIFTKKYNFSFNFNSEWYLILLLRYTITYFKENIKDFQLKNNLIKEISNVLNLIQSKKIDISKINLSSLDPEISKALSTLLNDVFNIYRTYRTKLLKKYFKKFKLKSKKKNYTDNDQKLERFFNICYSIIYKGKNLKKINYHSTGIKEHFYQIDYENDLFESFSNDNNSERPSKIYEFDNILKVLVGCKTRNIITKINQVNIKKKNCPYLFMSLVLRRRTIDFYFDDEINAKNWFYGLFYYFNISDRSYKINSCTNYILFRLKCKMIKKLREDITKMDECPLSSCMLKYLKTYIKSKYNYKKNF